MAENNVSKSAHVFLVGAGPGDPGLVALRAVECLRSADVVLYDYLVNTRILQWAPPHADLICLGKHGRDRIMPQAEINQRLVELAAEGKTVVRLKGGDPTIFARCAEEARALAKAGVAFEIVPGITAALAAPGCAGIAVTDRDVASAVAIVTGQRRADRDDLQLDFPALARFPGTLLFYMGVTTAPQWTAGLIEAGKSGATPVAIVRWCSLPEQEVIRCTLAKTAETVATRQIRPPVVFIVGEVVEKGPFPAWFASRPLSGRRVMITRPADQAATMRERLERYGAVVVEQPAIEIVDPPDWSPVDRALGRLDEYDWVVFSSANGVRFFVQRLLTSGRDLRCLAENKLAVIGPATADTLAAFHLRADLQPAEYRAEALAEILATQADGRRFLLVRASRGREVLREALAAAGAYVEQIVAYTSRDVTTPGEGISQALAAGHIDWITVTSSAIARSLFALFGRELCQARLASISPVTSQTLRNLGLEPSVEAELYTIKGLVDAIVAAGDGD